MVSRYGVKGFIWHDSEKSAQKLIGIYSHFVHELCHSQGHDRDKILAGFPMDREMHDVSRLAELLYDAEAEAVMRLNTW